VRIERAGVTQNCRLALVIDTDMEAKIMASLKELNNIQRARLLHQLFPEEIPGVLNFIAETCMVINNHPQIIRANWKNEQFTVELWLVLALDVECLIKRHGKNLEIQAIIFAEQLFSGILSVFLIHCLMQYAICNKSVDPKFSTAIDLFFCKAY